MKKIFFLIIAVLVVASTFVVSTPSQKPAKAYSNSNMIDDAVFDNSTTMSTAQIQNFLNQFPNSCLKNYTDEYPNDYFSYGGPVSAATVIRRASDLWGINPQVMLTKLEQEENLVTGNAGCPLYRYVSAVGFNCPGPTRAAVFRGTPVTTCVQNDANMGFSRQIAKGAWLLKWSKERANGNLNWLVPDDASYYYGGPMTQGTRKRSSASAAVYYDGYWNGVPMGSGATAALYNYTPFLNQAFPGIFESFFGANSTKAALYNYEFVTASPSNLTMEPTQPRNGHYITLKNTGTRPWYADGNVPTGEHPVRLKIKNYQNSPFADLNDPNWLGTQNQIKMATPVVMPGETGTFIFNFVGPYQYYSNFINNFHPVVDGLVDMKNINMQFVTSSQVPSYTFTSAVNPPNSITSNDKANASITIKNTSSTVWYADGAVPAGKKATRLTSIGNLPVSFADQSNQNWLGGRSKVKMSPDIVNPGENATFSMSFMGPFSSRNEVFKFAPEIDGFAQLKDIGMQFSLNTPAYSSAYQFVSATNPPTTMSPGSTANVQVVLKNNGSTIWRNEPNRIWYGSTRLMMPGYAASKFYSPSDTNWLANSQIGMTTATVLPGQNGIFNFQWKAPSVPGVYTERFMPVFDGYQVLTDIGMQFRVVVQ